MSASTLFFGKIRIPTVHDHLVSALAEVQSGYDRSYRIASHTCHTLGLNLRPVGSTEAGYQSRTKLPSIVAYAVCTNNKLANKRTPPRCQSYRQTKTVTGLQNM